MTTPWINIGECEIADRIDIKKVEEVKKCKYVGDFCIKQSRGWTERPVSVFYQPEPPVGYSPYFGLYFQDGTLMITDASSTVDLPIIGKQAEDGEIIFSRYRHDYRRSKDGTATIDGGRDYAKTSGGMTVMLIITGGELKILAERAVK